MIGLQHLLGAFGHCRFGRHWNTHSFAFELLAAGRIQLKSHSSLVADWTDAGRRQAALGWRRSLLPELIVYQTRAVEGAAVLTAAFVLVAAVACCYWRIEQRWPQVHLVVLASAEVEVVGAVFAGAVVDC